MFVRLVVFFIPLLAVLCSFQTNDISNDINQGLKNSNSKFIAKHFSSSINLSLNKEEQIVTRFQGELLLSDFFKQNKVVGLKRITAAGKDQSNRYFIYSIKTEKHSFRVIIKVIDLKGTVSISELRIE